MAKKLLIIESPGKIKKIKSFLGSDYDIVATFGHILDLPKKKLGVDIKNGFSTTYEVLEGKNQILEDICKKAKAASIVYLATDLDREGEGISQNVADKLPKGCNIKRIRYNSITKDAILDAIENAGEINKGLVDSYEARRVLDRLCGFKCSFITQTATGGKSAGRVQSAALRILAEREKEIQEFKPQEYWDIEAELLTPKKEKIVAHLVNPGKMEINCEEKANKIVSDLKKEKIALVTKYEHKDHYANPYPPFITSTLQQAASSVFGWAPIKTMAVAQTLYEGAFITYMRSDATYITPKFISDIRSHISSNFAATYIPEKTNFYKSSSNAQEAHEAIRPTDISVTTASSGDEQKLYQLIWKRTVASQMTQAKYHKVSARFSCAEYELAANGSRLVFDGYTKVWDYGKQTNIDLAETNVGDKCDIISAKGEQKFTQPPDRFTEAGFIKTLESSGIGRPSTYSAIGETLKKRKYVELQKKSYHVTLLGTKVSNFLVHVDFCFIDTGFTKGMEDKLDDIVQNKATRNGVLSEFWTRLQKDIDNAKTQKLILEKTNFTCPNCKSLYLLKHSQYGPFFACEKKCGNIAIVGPDGNPIEKDPSQKKELIKCDLQCPKCDADMVLRHGKFGDFYGCTKYSKGCRGMRDTENKEIVPKPKKKFFKKYKKKSDGDS